MKVRTNKVEYSLFYDDIKKDFSVVAVHFAKVDERNVAYSFPLLDFGIVATYATQKKKHDYVLYALVNNHKNGIHKYLDAIRAKAVEPLAKEIVPIAPDKENDYVLIQLLLGYLAIIDVNEDSGYANYYGRLYASKVPYMPSTYKTVKVNKNTLMFNPVQYTKDNTLSIVVESWMPFSFNLERKSGKMKRPKNVLSWKYLDDAITRIPWEEVKNRVNQWIKTPLNKRESAEKALFAHWYVQGVPNHKVKNKMPLFTITRLDKFSDKLKIRKELMENIEDELGKYLVFKPVSEEMEKYAIAKKTVQKDDRADKIHCAIQVMAKKGLAIVYKTEEQRELAEQIKSTLLNDSLLGEMHVEYIQVQKALNPKAWNIQVVLPKDSKLYCDEKGSYCVDLDDYEMIPGVCIQHYVKESVKEDLAATKNKLIVCLLELLVKDSLIAGKLPACLCPVKDITVVKRVKDKDCWYVFALQVTAQGEIKNQLAFIDDGICLGEEEFDIHEKFSTIDTQNKGIKSIRPVEGLIKMDNGPYLAIYKTTEFPMPHYDKLLEDLQKSVGKDLTKARCYEYMDEYLSMNPEFEPVFAYVKEEMQQDGSLSIGVSQWETLLRKACSKKNNDKLSKGKKLTGFSEFVAEKSQGQILLVLNVKTEKNGNPYDMDHLTGIVYKESPQYYSYYVGYRTLQNLNTTSTIDKASPIRMVEKDTSYTFDDYASLLDVSWVRAGTLEATVLPFPFKILNEYMKTALPELQKQNEVEEE